MGSDLLPYGSTGWPLVEAIEAKPFLKVVTFESAKQDCFLLAWTNRPAASASRVGSRRPSGSRRIGRAANLARNVLLIVDENPLIGTWKLRSHVVTTAAGKPSTPYGESPTGYLSYAVDGRMQVIGTANSRIVPAGPTPTDDERLALYDTMFAYAGRYSIQSDKVVHHVDISWNEHWTGTEQVRQFVVSGNTLTLTSRIADPATGTEAHYSVVWEKVAPP